MKKNILLPAILLLAGAGSANAQKYPSTDADGNTVYYKIVSAYPEYSKKCIADNSRYASTTGYNFLIADLNDQTTLQDWKIVAYASSDTTKYFLRNRSTNRYISTEGEWKNNYYAQKVSNSKTGLSPFTFVDLKDNQIAIKITGDGGDRYLFAADSAQAMPSFNSYAMENSVWAWKVCLKDGTPISVRNILKNNNIKVEVVNRVIKVSGTDTYSVVTDDGALLPRESVLAPGIYFVNAKGVSYKVLVK